MKTLKTTLFIAALSATFSLMAAEPSNDPNLIPAKQLGKRTPSVVLAAPTSGYQEPNLTAGIRPGGKHVAFNTVTGTAATDPNLLAMVENCSLPPKLKGDSAACKACCAATTAMK